MKISFSKSIFYFKPILQFLNNLSIVPQDYHSGTIFCILDPLNPKYFKFKKESHLTDKQLFEEQIRFLGIEEIKRKIIRLAHNVATILNDEQITIYSDGFDNIGELNWLFFQKIIEYNPKLSFKLSLDQKLFFENKFECFNEFKIIKSLKENKETEGYNLIKYCKNIINSGDYFTAINVLNNLLDITDHHLSSEIECMLGACNEFLGRTLNSEKHWLYALENGNFNQRYRASYSLSMLYIRHHPKKYLNISKGKAYLNKMLDEIINNKDISKPEALLLKTFNRNGYALALFKEDKIDQAQELVSVGIEQLSLLDSNQSMFHKSVLIFNLYQCYLKKEEYLKAEEQLLNLIEIDYKFLLYHEYLLDFYCKLKKWDLLKEASINALKLDYNHYKFNQFLGISNYMMNNYIDAEKYLKKTISLNSQAYTSIALLSNIFTSNNKFEDLMILVKKIDPSLANKSVLNIINRNFKLANRALSES